MEAPPPDQMDYVTMLNRLCVNSAQTMFDICSVLAQNRMRPI